MSDAVSTCFDAYSALILGLEHEQATYPNSDGANKAKGILKHLRTFKFISTLSLLNEILHVLDKACKMFQKDTLDIHQLKTMLAATKACREWREVTTEQFH